MRNHLGSYECKLCLTLHTNEVRFSPFSALHCTARKALRYPNAALLAIPRHTAGFIEFLPRCFALSCLHSLSLSLGVCARVSLSCPENLGACMITLFAGLLSRTHTRKKAPGQSVSALHARVCAAGWRDVCFCFIFLCFWSCAKGWTSTLLSLTHWRVACVRCRRTNRKRRALKEAQEADANPAPVSYNRHLLAAGSVPCITLLASLHAYFPGLPACSLGFGIAWHAGNAIMQALRYCFFACLCTTASKGARRCQKIRQDWAPRLQRCDHALLCTRVFESQARFAVGVFFSRSR